MKSNTDGLSNIVVRELCMADYEKLITFWNEVKLPYKPRGRDKRENIERELKGQNAIFLVAEKDGGLVGSIFGTHDGRKGWINRLAVAPAYRRQRLAALLVQEIENRLFTLGIGIIACLVEDWNKVSLKVFKKLGYTHHRDIIYFTKRKFPDV
jgi:ribosomal protein S18 acetylase RimI-like enzyme